MKEEEKQRRLKELNKEDSKGCLGVFILIALAVTTLFLLSCTTDPQIECNQDCGKLITKMHRRDFKVVEITFVTNCNDTLIDVIELNSEHLGNDNGVTYFINAFDLGEYYCKN